MWDFIWNIGLIIVAITVGAIVLTLLLANYLRSKILCLVSGGVAIYFGSQIEALWDTLNKDGADLGQFFTTLIWAILFTILAWLFFVGPAVLEEYWDGSWNLIENSDFYSEDNTSAGLIGHFIGAVIVVGGGYFFLGQEFPAIFYILPLAIMGLNVLGFLKNLIFNRD